MGSLNEAGINTELCLSTSLRVEPAEDSWHLANEHRSTRLCYQQIQVDRCYGESMHRLLLCQDHRSVNHKRQMEPSPIIRSQHGLMFGLYDWYRQKTTSKVTVKSLSWPSINQGDEAALCGHKSYLHVDFIAALNRSSHTCPITCTITEDIYMYNSILILILIWDMLLNQSQAAGIGINK